MKMCVITHMNYRMPGLVSKWAEKQGFKVHTYRPFAGEKLPEENDFDWITVMGGPQDALHIQDAPYLQEEIDFLKKMIAQNKTVLGFCLGAQLIGEALGARTERSPEREIGLFEIALTKSGKNDLFLQGIPDKLDVMHWHNYMPGLTANAKVLAYSEGCPRQIVRYDERIFGFQCHPEMLSETLPEMIDSYYDANQTGPFIRSKEHLLSYDFSSMNAYLEKILKNMHSAVYARC